jgi:hypothetical protein
MATAPEWKCLTESSVLRAWAVAEATSEKTLLGEAVREGRCSAELRDKLLGGRSDDLTETEWQALERAILTARGPMLAGLLALRPDWYEGDMPVADLANMRFFNVPDWTAKTPSRNWIWPGRGICRGRAGISGLRHSYRAAYRGRSQPERPVLSHRRLYTLCVLAAGSPGRASLA